MGQPIGDAPAAPDERCSKTAGHIPHHWHTDGSPIGLVPNLDLLRMCDGEGSN